VIGASLSNISGFGWAKELGASLTLSTAGVMLSILIGLHLESLERNEAAVERSRLPTVKHLVGAQAIYGAATSIVNESGDKKLYATDFRYVSREDAEGSATKAYLDVVVAHLNAHQNAQYYRAIGAHTRDQCLVLADQLKEALPHLARPSQLPMAYHFVNPLAMDALVGETSVLLAFPDSPGVKRSGLLISDKDIAEMLRSWYRNVVRDRQHSPPGQPPKAIQSDAELRAICP